MKNKYKLKPVTMFVIDGEQYYESWKQEIIDSIKKEWDISKVGIYMEKNRPQWLKDIVPGDYHPLDTVANDAADKFLHNLFGIKKN